MKHKESNISPITFVWIGMLVTGFILIILAIGIQYIDQKQGSDVSLTLLMEEKLKEQDEVSSGLVLSHNERTEEEDSLKLSTTVTPAPSSDVTHEADSTETSTNSNDNTVEIVNASQSNKIDINSATVDQLQQLKGIGPAKAKAIIADRDQKGKYKNIADIKRVKGIGEKLYEGIQESIVAEP